MSQFFKVRKDHLWLLSCMVAAYSHSAVASDTFQYSKHIDPLLGLDFSSTMNSEYGHDDNVFFQKDNDVIGSDYYALSPTLSVQGKRNTKKFDISYHGDYRQYLDHMAKMNSYDDHRVNGEFEWELGFRHHLELTGSYSLGHEALGTGVTNGFFFTQNNRVDTADATFSYFNINNSIKITNKKAGIKYTYGAKEAKGRVVFELTQAKLSYDIVDSYNESFKNYLKNETLTENDATVTFIHNYSNKTSFGYTLKYKDYNYVGSIRDNDEFIGAFTVISQFTGRSKLEATIYNLNKKMANNTFNGINWSVIYKWQPFDYSTITLKTLSEVKEPDDAGDFIKSYLNSIAFEHQFLGHVTGRLSYSHTNSHYQIKERKDKYDYLDLSLNYLFRPKIEFTFAYGYSFFSTKNSSESISIDGKSYKGKLGYNQNQFSLSVKVAI